MVEYPSWWWLHIADTEVDLIHGGISSFASERNTLYARTQDLCGREHCIASGPAEDTMFIVGGEGGSGTPAINDLVALGTLALDLHKPGVDTLQLTVQILKLVGQHCK